MARQYDVNVNIEPDSQGKGVVVRDFREMEQASGRFKDSLSGVQGNLLNVGKQARQVSNLTDQLATSMGVATGKANAMASIMRQLYAYISAFAIYSFIRAAVRGFGEWELALINVAKTTNLTREQTLRLGDSLRRIARDAPIASHSLAQIAAAAGQVGVRGEERLAKFSKTVADLTIATNLYEEEAVFGLKRVLDLTNESIDSASRLSSVWVALGNNFAVTERQIVSFATEIARATSIYGISSEHVSALGAAFGASGASPQLARNAMARVFASMNEALVGNLELLKEWSKLMNISAKEFEELWGQGSAGRMELFSKALQQFGYEGEKSVVIMDNLGLSQQRTQLTLQGLAKIYQSIYVPALQMANEEHEKATAQTQEVQKFYQALTNQLSLVGNVMSQVFEKIGEAFSPLVLRYGQETKAFFESILDSNALVAWSNKAAGALEVVYDQFDRLIALVGALGTKGPLMSAFQTISIFLSASGVTEFVKSVVTFKAFIPTLTQFFTGGFLASLKPILDLFRGRFSGAGGLFGLLGKSFSRFVWGGAGIGTLFNVIKAPVDGIITGFKTVANAAGIYIDVVFKRLGPIFLAMEAVHQLIAFAKSQGFVSENLDALATRSVAQDTLNRLSSIPFHSRTDDQIRQMEDAEKILADSVMRDKAFVGGRLPSGLTAEELAKGYWQRFLSNAIEYTVRATAFLIGALYSLWEDFDFTKAFAGFYKSLFQGWGLFFSFVSDGLDLIFNKYKEGAEPIFVSERGRDFGGTLLNMPVAQQRELMSNLMTRRHLLALGGGGVDGGHLERTSQVDEELEYVTRQINALKLSMMDPAMYRQRYEETGMDALLRSYSERYTDSKVGHWLPDSISRAGQFGYDLAFGSQGDKWVQEARERMQLGLFGADGIARGQAVEGRIQQVEELRRDPYSGFIGPRLPGGFTTSTALPMTEAYAEEMARIGAYMKDLTRHPNIHTIPRGAIRPAGTPVYENIGGRNTVTGMTEGYGDWTMNKFFGWAREDEYDWVDKFDSRVEETTTRMSLMFEDLFVHQIPDHFSHSVLSVLDGTQSMKEAFKSLADMIARTVLQTLIRIGVEMAIIWGLRQIGFGGNTAVGSDISSGPALGGGPSPAWYARNVTPTGATGGLLRGVGGPAQDNIPTLLSNGEFVMNAGSTSKYLPLLEAMNANANVMMAAGGGTPVKVTVEDHRPASSPPLEIDVEPGLNVRQMSEVKLIVREDVQNSMRTGELDTALRQNYGQRRPPINR